MYDPVGGLITASGAHCVTFLIKIVIEAKHSGGALSRSRLARGAYIWWYITTSLIVFAVVSCHATRDYQVKSDLRILYAPRISAQRD